jgi:hypothetical protein
MCVFQDGDMDEDNMKSFRPPNNTQLTRLYGRLVLGRREAAVGSGSGCIPPRVRWRIAIGCDLSASGLRAVANLQGSDARDSSCSKAVKTPQITLLILETRLPARLSYIIHSVCRKVMTGFVSLQNC